MKGNIYLAAGSVWLILAGFTIAAGIGHSLAYPPGDPQHIPSIALVIGGLCTGTGVVPALVLIWLGLRARKLERELVEFASWVKTYRRIGMTQLAHKLGKSQFETEKTLTRVIDKGLIRGFIDRTTDEFVIQEAMFHGVFVGVCPNCGGRVEKQFLLGETPVCPYCRSVITPRPAGPPPTAGPPGRQP